MTEGYWVLVAPLPPGEHEIRYGGGLPDIGVPFGEVIYHLTVAEPTVAEPPAATPEATPAG